MVICANPVAQQNYNTKNAVLCDRVPVTRVMTHSLADPDMFFINSFKTGHSTTNSLIISTLLSLTTLLRPKNAAHTSNKQPAAGCRPIAAVDCCGWISALGLKCSTLPRYTCINLGNWYTAVTVEKCAMP